MEALASKLGEALAAQVHKLFTRLEAELRAKIEAAAVTSALIDRAGVLVLTFGDGSTLRPGTVLGPEGPPGPPGPPAGSDPLALRVQAMEARPVVVGGVIDHEGALLLSYHDGSTLRLGAVAGAQGPQGPPGPAGPANDDGPLAGRVAALEGRAVVGALIGQDGRLVLACADGSRLDAGRAVGRDGVDGRDGAPGEPGLGFEDLACTLGEDGRTVTLRFERGGRAMAFDLVLPAMVYRGVYEAGRAYLPGDTVTFGGSAWVCGAATTERPGEEASGWTLAVKRGRDGKDFAGPQIKAHA
jgi:integrin beta 3